MKTISEQFKGSVEEFEKQFSYMQEEFDIIFDDVGNDGLRDIKDFLKEKHLSICDNEMKRLHEVIAENKEDDVHGDFEDALLHSINYWKDEREIITNHK